MRRFFLVSILALIPLSCGSDNPANSGLEGNYRLDSMTIEGGGISITMGPPQITGNLTLSGNQFTISFSAQDGPSEVDNGIFTTSGGTITFTSNDDGSTTIGQISSGQITFS